MPFPSQQGAGRVGAQCGRHVPWVSSPRTARHADIPATRTCAFGLLDPALPVKVGEMEELGDSHPLGGTLGPLLSQAPLSLTEMP